MSWLAVAGYVFLPSAEITLTPKEEPIPPIPLTVRADPDATATDADAGVVPADRLEVPVEVSNTFQTQGRRVEESTATGTVTFRNVDFTESNTIAAGAVVSTQGGVRFRLDRSVTVGKAELVGLQVIPTEANVSVTAVNPGPSGNVEPNTITVIPAAEDPTTLVGNKAATSGRARDEFPQVSEAEVTAALEQLNAQLADTFAAAVADGAAPRRTPPSIPRPRSSGRRRRRSTRRRSSARRSRRSTSGSGPPARSSPSTPGRSGASPSRGSGERRRTTAWSTIRSRSTPARAPSANGQVTFPVSASASRVRLLDPAELLELVKGKTIEDAETALAPFGDVEIVPWPDWVSSVPTMDSRVSLVIVGQGEAAEGAGASASPGPASPGADGSP